MKREPARLKDHRYACQECKENDRYALWWDTVVEAD
jgi:hypothetical protein